MQIAIRNREDQLAAFIARARASDVPEEVQAYLFRLGAILVCGHIEQCIKIVILDRLVNRAHKRIINFVKSHFDRGQNLDCVAIKQLLDRFDPTWGKLFEQFIEANEDIKQGVSSAYSIRNPIAHGGTMSLGAAGLVSFFEVSKRLIQGVIDSTSRNAA